MLPCIVTNFFLIKPTDALISQIYFVKKLYMFRAVPLPIIGGFPLYIRHWYMSYRSQWQLSSTTSRARKLSWNLYDIYQCRMYSGKPPMMGRETARNM